MDSTKAISKVYFNQGIQIVEDVANLVFGNAIRMASIGFNVRKVMKLARKPNSTAEGVEDVTQYFGGYDFVEALLMEWSITVLGADAGALKQSASRKAVNGHSLSERMVQYLTAAAGPLVKQNQSGFNGWNALWNPDEPQTKQSAFWMPEDDEPQGGTQTQSTEPNVEVLRFTPEKFREIINNEVQSAIDKLSEAGKAGAESGQQYAQEIGAGVDNNSGNVEIQQSQSEEIIRFDQIEQQYSEQKTQSEPPLTAEQIAAAVTQQVNNALEPRFEKLEKDANKFEQQLRQATGQLPG